MTRLRNMVTRQDYRQGGRVGFPGGGGVGGGGNGYDPNVGQPARGERGYTGERGAAGVRGEAGARGVAGVAGSRGERGYAGTAGASGAAGTAGARGAAGARGTAGTAGARGAAGASGAAGGRGAAGARGAAGGRGERGYAGTAGKAGGRGERGVAGTAGKAGGRGESGEAGLRGGAGQRGEKGYAGERGERGEVGLRGEAGATFDPTALRERLKLLEKTEAFDPTGLQARLAELEKYYSQGRPYPFRDDQPYETEENGGGGGGGDDETNGEDDPYDDDDDDDQPPGGGMWWKDKGFDTIEEALAAGWYFDGETGQWTLGDPPPVVIDDPNLDPVTGEAPEGYIADPEGYARWLAGGEGPKGAAVAKDAVKADLGGTYSAEEVNLSWQDGGFQGTLLKNQQGLTGQNIFEALWGDNFAQGLPANDSVEIEGTTYTWDDFHNLIAKEANDFIGAYKPGGVTARSTEMADMFGTEASTAAQWKKDPDGNFILDADGNPVRIGQEDVQTAVRADNLPVIGEAIGTSMYAAAQGGLDPEALVLAATQDQTYIGGEAPSYNPKTGMIEQGGVETEFKSWTPEEFAIESGLNVDDYVFAPAIDAQTGEWDVGTIASTQSKALTFAATGVDVDKGQAAQALANNVSENWGLDAGAKIANAAKVAGLDLPRILRSKKQLRKAGLSEADINLFANDPDLLEDELLNYTEAQRGMVAGLPEEALVSVQMNALLEGMESGEIPNFAKPAVAAVNEMLIARGMDASTVGRDMLFNAIIQSAMPLAQSNAASVKEGVMQQRGIEATAELQNAQARQATATFNAEKVFSLNMAQFSAEQQTELSNSKFLQTTTLTDTTNSQQAIMAKAASMAQLDLGTLDANTKIAAQNAQTFLQRNMTDLTNAQQSEVLNTQMEQQRMLTNQAADNASFQFNATSDNQTKQFMKSLGASIDQYNDTQHNAMAQFNATSDNAAEARKTGILADIEKYNSQLLTQTDQFNEQIAFNREQWNKQNWQAVEQANVAWRQKANLANTASQNTVNMQNAMNAFGLNQQSLAFLWQDLRDAADFDFRGVENVENRKIQILSTAIANEGKAGETYDNYLKLFLSSIVSSFSPNG